MVSGGSFWLYVIFVSVELGSWVSKWVTWKSENANVSHSDISDSLQLHGLWPSRLLYPWNSPGKNARVGCHSLLQGIFPTQGLNPGLLHCRQILYHLNYQESQYWNVLKTCNVPGVESCSPHCTLNCSFDHPALFVHLLACLMQRKLKLYIIHSLGIWNWWFCILEYKSSINVGRKVGQTR